MSHIQENLDSQRTDAIDFIMERISIILLRKQSVSFEKLRRLTLLSTTVSDTKEYSEIIVLSLIKHLELDSAFKEEIKENRNSYRLFNALNLNDDRINGFFVEFIAVIAPELFTALSAVLAQLAIRLAEKNKSKYSRDRMARLQDRINLILEEDPSPDEDEYVEEDAKTKAIETPKRKVRRASFIEYIACASSPTKLSEKSHSSTEAASKKSKVIKRKENRLTLEGLSIGANNTGPDESASETAARLVKQKQRRLEDIDSADEDALPTREEIAKAKANVVANDDESSIVF